MSLSVSVSSVSQTSFSAKVRTTGSVPMQHNWYLDGALYKTIQTGKGETSSSCFFSGLSPGTNYSVRVVVYAFNPWRELDRGTASTTTKSSGSGSTDPPEPSRPTRPADWYWQSLGSSGSPFDMPASEWNAFVSRIQEFAEYKGISLSSSTVSRARASRGTPPLASQANAVCALIDRLNPRVGVPYNVDPGDYITRAFFMDLKNALNSVS